MKRRMIAVIMLLTVALTGCAQQTPKTKQSAVGFYFDTVITLTAYAGDDSTLKAALDECARYEKMLSKTVEGSDVWNVNHAGGMPVTVSEDTVRILETARSVYDLSGGAFDVTIAPAAALWNFKNEPVLPDAAALKAAIALTDLNKMTVSGNTVTLPAGMQIDLGGIAKGYIADRLCAFLKERGIDSAVLSLGGNVVAIGLKPDDSDWRVGIQDPDQPTGRYMMVADVKGGSVVTSGVYERGFDLGGVRYHHILNTKTGWPVQNGLKSVTIFSESSALGDALSTATFCLGLTEGLKLIESLDGVEAIFVENDRTVSYSSGARAYIVQ